MSTPTTEAPGAATLSPVEREAALRLDTIDTAYSLLIEAELLFASRKFVDAYAKCDAARAALAARLRAPVAPAPIEPGEGWRVEVTPAALTLDYGNAISIVIDDDGIGYALRREGKMVPGSHDADQDPLSALQEISDALAALPKPAAAPADTVPVSREAPSVAERMILAKREPTQAMIQAGVEAIFSIFPDTSLETKVRHIYLRMCEVEIEIDRLLEGARG